MTAGWLEDGRFLEDGGDKDSAAKGRRPAKETTA